MNPRVTAGMRRAVVDVLALSATYPSMSDLVEALAVAVVTSDDRSTRYVVGSRDPHGNTTIYGPYATAAAAEKAMAAGACATVDGTTGAVYPLVPSPKRERAPRKPPAAQMELS